MINYIILCVIIVIFIFYLNSINESFSCPICPKNITPKYINVYILDTNKNYSAYINRDNVDNIIIKSFNNLREDNHKYFLKNVETIDYETNLRNTYQYVETKKTNYIQDNHIDNYVKNDVDLFHHYLNNNNDDEMIYMLNKMINNFDNYNDINLFCIPYLDSKILKIINKNNYIIGLYDKGTPNRTIPFLPSNLSYNWLSDYNIYTDEIININSNIDNLKGEDTDTKSYFKTKNNIYMEIVKIIDEEETKANIKKLKNDLIKNDYELSQLYIIDHNKLHSVKNIKNTKTKQAKIEEELNKTKAKIKILIDKNKEINNTIKECDEKIISELKPKIDPPFDKNYKLYLKKLYNELQDYYNRPSPNCKKIQQYEKQKLKLQTFINKHKKYYKNMDLIIDLHDIIDGKYNPTKPSMPTKPYKLQITLDEDDLDKCSNIPNNLKLICDESNNYQYDNIIEKQEQIDLLNGEITNPILSSSDTEDLKDDLNELTFTKAANICFNPIPSIPSNIKPLLNINSVINKPPLNVNSNDYYLNKFSNSYI